MKKIYASFTGWLDSRTGYRDQVREALYENIPSGARWRYVSGSMLVFAFAVQVITGLFLWTAYSPSSQTAWESVYYIQHEMQGGWLLRGIHHVMAQMMVVLLGIHLLQVIVDGAYKAPREINYWLGIILMQIVLALGLTGYLLPWDQKGYWATNVATNLMTLVPFVGAELQQIVLGGKEYGHHTLTRFFALHAGILPGLLVAVLALHLSLFRKHGITAKITPNRPDQYFWPTQVLLDGLASLALLVFVLLLVVHFDVIGLFTGNLPEAHRGAELGAPADPSEQFSAARPEWYFLFLFQLLKYFKSEFVGAIVVPGVVMLILILAPLIARVKHGHKFNVAYIVLLLGAAATLTVLAIVDDSQDAAFAEAKIAAEHDAERIHELVQRRETSDGQPLMIPREGAVWLVRNDPKLQGPRLFERHCASCHDYADPENSDHAANIVTARYYQPLAAPESTPKEPVYQKDKEGKILYNETPNGAPNLYGFASRNWIAGLLDPKQISLIETKDVKQEKTGTPLRQITSAPYFGNTAHRDGDMAAWLKKHAKDFDPEDIAAIAAALSAQARLPAQSAQDAADGKLIARGVSLMEMNCTKGCHRLGEAGSSGLSPDLTGYGSYEWMMGLVSDPGHRRFYGAGNDRMPAFAEDLSRPESHKVSLRELSLIVHWLRGEYYQADAESPLLPRSPTAADLAVHLSRQHSGDEVVGKTPQQESELHRAEKLFTRNCAPCHDHTNEFGQGIAAVSPSAPNLYGFGSRDWLAGFLDVEKITSPRYFGHTEHFEGEMVEFVQDNLVDLGEEQQADLAALVALLSGEAELPAQKEADEKSKADGTFGRGREALVDNFACTDCHKFHDEGYEGPPDLTGWASREWLIGMISDPTHDRFYNGNNDRMPRFARRLSTEEIELLAKFLRGEISP